MCKMLARSEVQAVLSLGALLVLKAGSDQISTLYCCPLSYIVVAF